MRLEPDVLLEIACGTIDDAVIAADGGADRLELCSAMELGGLTPSLGTAFEVADLDVPFVAMVRPRAGDFIWSPAEIDAMVRDVSLLLDAGSAGVVFGCLTAAGDVDVRQCERLMEACGEGDSSFHTVQTVFHRAFDDVRDPRAALEDLIGLGMTRVLTSGGAKTALEGVARIRQLVEQAAGRIEILPGGGIRENNVEEVVRQTGCAQVHLSRR